MMYFFGYKNAGSVRCDTLPAIGHFSAFDQLREPLFKVAGE